ncbi:glycoside hydrolase family 3 protein, partial [Halomarina rubra]
MAPDTAVTALLDSLTREEKLRLVHGAVDPDREATGYVPGVERLGIPPLRLVDGPLGIRTNTGTATAFPASVALAATFDPALAESFGAALGREATAHGQDVVLAPGVNVVRVPQCGRNFEYFSEDPHLAGELAASVVAGVQSAGVLATVKHYVANNQETDRCAVSADVDERTLRELYLRPFRRAVEADVGMVMTAYNRVNGTHMSDHRRLVTEVLKDEWGFEGVVVSDWHGTTSTVGAATAGLDLEMPGVPATELFEGAFSPDFDPTTYEPPDGLPDVTSGGLFGDPLGEAIDAGEVPASRLDDMVGRLLGQMARLSLLDGDKRDSAPFDRTAHRDLAERIAVEGTVLLSNDGVLPVSEDADVALLGPGVDTAKLGGGGSSEVTPTDSTSPRAGIEARATGTVAVEPGVAAIERVSLFDRLPFDLSAESGTEHDEVGEGDDSATAPSLARAVAVAEEADVAVVFVEDAVTEGRDRATLSLPGEQDELVAAVG